MRFLQYYFLMFICYAFFGWCFECVHMAITTKEIVNRGYLNGPIVPVYGIGLTLIVTLLSGFKDNFILLFFLALLIIATVEYLTSVVLEKIFKIRWWDYTNYKFNLNGRICLNTMTIFIIGAMIMIYLVNPTIIRLLNLLNTKWLTIIATILLILFLIDNILSFKVAKQFVTTSNSKRLDKTPDIRKYTRSLIFKNTK